MALVKCPECGKEMSEWAKICPNCGCPNHLEQLRKSQAAAERQRKESITSTIHFYDDQLWVGLGVLAISIITGYASYKWMDTNLAVVFLVFILVSWCLIINQKMPVGIIGSLIIMMLVVTGLAKLNLPDFMGNIIVIMMLIYPLYFMIIRPLINVVRIKLERKKLKD